MKKTIYDLLEVSKKDAENGVWFDGFPLGIEMKLRYIKSDYVGAVARDLSKKTDRERKLAKDDELRLLKLEIAHGIKLLAQGIVADWKNVLDRDGVEIKYSEENVEKFLTDLPEMCELILPLANAGDEFLKSTIEEDEKNLQNS